MNPSVRASNMPPTPSSARGSAQRKASGASAAPPSARGTLRDPQLSERRASHSMVRDTPFTSVPRSHRGGGDLETPTRSRGGALSSARRSTMDFVQTTGNAMKVYVRVRPFSERELSHAGTSAHSTVRIDAENPAMITVLDPSKEFRPIVTYKFTRCFWSVFERTNDDLQRDRTMTDMRDTVDTYLNGGMNSARRPRNQSIVGDSRLTSARGNGAKGGAADAVTPYLGSGSNAAVAEANISHPAYAGQEEIFKQVGRPILANTLEGYNGCVFAYGQTGSGKTFTMMGYAPAPADFRRRRESVAPASARAAPAGGDASATPSPQRGGRLEMASFASQSGVADNNTDSPEVLPLDEDDGEDVVNKAGLDPIELMGIIPRISADLFAGLRGKREKDASWSYRVEVSYYEIYNEKIFDLIKPARSADLKVRNNPATGPYVDGLATKVCLKEEDVMRVIRNGMQERHTAATKFNDRSSRSHAILNFNLLQLSLDNTDNTLKMQSKLNLVDLAGSERAGAAGADRPEFREGVNINQSLTVLGRVIDCLADLSQNKSLAVPVPYRDSTLTLLLMDSIGGNSQTAMIATVSPHMINLEEMKQTLRYASRATVILNRAVINEDPQMRQIKLLTGQVERLQQLLKESGGCEFTNDDIREMQRKIKMLERKVGEQERIIAGLRAELERAGIADPTVEESFGEGAAAQVQQDRKRDEQLQKKFDILQAELFTTKAELERRGKADPEAIAALKKTVLKQEKEIATLKTEGQVARQLGIFYLDRAANDLTNVFSYVQAKENVFSQNCWMMLLNTNSEAGAVATRLERENEERLRELTKRHDEELREREDRYKQRIKDMQAEHNAQQQSLLAKHKDALAAIEEQMQKNRDIHEEERRRLEVEKEAIRKQGTDAAAKAREVYQQDLEKLRKKFEAENGDRRGGDNRLMADQHAREMDRLNDELDRAKRSKESEIARLRKQLENEQLRRESDLMEKDRQRRAVDGDLSAARRDLLTLQSEKNKSDADYQDQIRDLVRQQEELINISNSVLGDWESKSADMEGQMCKLRALIYDKDYMNFRQKMREKAFGERSDISKELTEVEEKKRRQAEVLKKIQDKVKRTMQDQKSTLSRMEQTVMWGNRTTSPAPPQSPGGAANTVATNGDAKNGTTATNRQGKSISNDTPGNSVTTPSINNAK